MTARSEVPDDEAWKPFACPACGHVMLRWPEWVRRADAHRDKLCAECGHVIEPATPRSSRVAARPFDQENGR